MTSLDHSELERDAVIDVLRGVAILAVLLLHFALAFGISDSWLGDLIPKPWLGRVVNNGNYGVTIFFVVSGYLITRGLLVRHGSLAQIDWKRFYVARASRIVPPLLLALSVIVPLGLSGVPGFDNNDGGVQRPATFWWTVLASVLGFWHNQLMQTAGYFNYSLNVYWSLSVEEVFYLGLPLACLALHRERYLVLTCGVLLVLGPVYRAANATNEIAYLYAYPACFDAIAAGVLCALIEKRVDLQANLARPVSWIVVAAMLAVWLVGFGDYPALGFSAMAALTATLIALTRRPLNGRMWFAATPLRWLGRLSYELYLFHSIWLALWRLLLTREQIGHDVRFALFIAFVTTSGMLAAAIHRWYAEPLQRRWRNQKL
jgi:peptidoglycan/LPS O-acetylase OafA/YrhL